MTRFLELVGLAAPRRDVQLRKFSKGMLQRVGIAQAILHDPQVVFLDEPMSGLDPVGRREVRDIILDLKRQGRTIFFSTHILSDAEMLCDRVAVLVDGKLHGVGSPGEIVSMEVQGMEILFEVARREQHLPPNIAGAREKYRQSLSDRSGGRGALRHAGAIARLRGAHSFRGAAAAVARRLFFQPGGPAKNRQVPAAEVGVR